MTKLSRILQGLTQRRGKPSPPPEPRPCRFEWSGYDDALMEELFGGEEKEDGQPDRKHSR